MTNRKEITAAIIIIGNEVLSGRTKDINTSTLAKWLNSHSKVSNVSYPGLGSDPYHKRAKQYLSERGMGCMLMFSLKGKD